MGIRDLTNFQVEDLGEIQQTRLSLEADVDGAQFNSWLADNSASIRRLYQQNGALLLRGLPISSSKKLARVLTTLFEQPLMEYQYRSTPRSKMRGQIYTSSEYHADETIALHNENAYANSWAMNIAFYCALPAEQGGATPIADSRKVFDAIDPQIRQAFEAKKLLYVRNYGELDLPWHEVFQTRDRQQVEQYCEQNNIEFEWWGENNLRTRQLSSAICQHPVTKQTVWFNQAHLFHISSLSVEHQNSLLDVVEKSQLPRNVYFGDGSDICHDMLSHIRQAYLDNMIVFDWKIEDLLLLDNMLYCHGRQPYVGNRRVLVGMSTPHGR